MAIRKSSPQAARRDSAAVGRQEGAASCLAAPDDGEIAPG